MLRDLKYFFLISRPVNVLISFISFGLACFIASSRHVHFISHEMFWATSLMIILIAATGYWINDIYDFKIDRINRPDRTVVNAILSVKKVLTGYIIGISIILLFSVVFIGYYKRHPEITLINILSVGLLFVYASFLKKVGVVGNFVIGLLIILVVLLGGYLYGINFTLLWMMAFAFQITLIREITKDVQDIKGDLAYKLRTLPIQIGMEATKQVLLILYILFLISCLLPVIIKLIRTGEWLFPYLVSSVLLVQIPTIWLIQKMMKAKEPEDFAYQSGFLKLLMLSGIITLFFLN
ncbi:MAG: UbiA family prenyltransferase [Bacteroidota bacterium]